MQKPTERRIPEALVIPVVADGAIGGRHTADGRVLPVLILDTTDRPDVVQLMRVHEHLSGNVASQWGSSPKKDEVVLVLNFRQPMEVEFVLLFSIEHHALLVEMMLLGGAVYLMAGAPGDRLSDKLGELRVLIELTQVDFRPIWDKLFRDRMTSVMARRLGTSKRKARAAAEREVAGLRKLAGLRLE